MIKAKFRSSDAPVIASNEKKTSGFFVKFALEKPGVTHAVYLIGRYLAFTEPFAGMLQTVRVMASSVESLISSFQSVLNQEFMDLNIVSNI